VATPDGWQRRLHARRGELGFDSRPEIVRRWPVAHAPRARHDPLDLLARGSTLRTRSKVDLEIARRRGVEVAVDVFRKAV
jgi:hypothetical protein